VVTTRDCEFWEVWDVVWSIRHFPQEFTMARILRLGGKKPFSATLLVALALGIFAPSLLAQVPPLTGRVNDLAGVLDSGTRAELENALGAYEERSGHQFAVLTVPSLGGVPIEDFSMRVVETWKLGHADRDDGLLLLIAKNDRRMRIEVGYGLEGAIPDHFAKGVIESVLTPHFRKGDFSGGIKAAMELLMRRAQDENVGIPARPRGADWTFDQFFLLAFFSFFVCMFLGAATRRMGFWRVPTLTVLGGGVGLALSGMLVGLVVAAIGSAIGALLGGLEGWGSGGGGGYTSSSWSSSSSSSSWSSSSSSFSGGGGSFGGGGASGGW
jgi:uncharacterized protein